MNNIAMVTQFIATITEWLKEKRRRRAFKYKFREIIKMSAIN
jgi:hypothetical protein